MLCNDGPTWASHCRHPTTRAKAAISAYTDIEARGMSSARILLLHPALENTDRTASSKSFSRTNSAATGRSATITGLAPLSSKRPYASELLTSGPPRSKVAGATPSPHQWDDKVYAGSAAALLKVGDKQRN